jgi:hypothetical protein
MKFFHRVVYGFLNGCIIFSIAAGSSSVAGAGISPQANAELAGLARSSISVLLSTVDVPSAAAQSDTTPQDTSEQAMPPSEEELQLELNELQQKIIEYEKAKEELEKKRDQVETIYKESSETTRKNVESSSPKIKKLIYKPPVPFFKKWF